jgi:hypothetical protein
MPQNVTTWGRWLYFPSEEIHATDFIALKNPSLSAGFETANMGSSGKQYNHYTTENDPSSQL